MKPAVVHPTRLGQAYFRALSANTVIESSPEIVGRINQISDRLHRARGVEFGRFEIVVPWSEQLTAYTLSGHFIYLTRRLYDYCPLDEQLAFVIAHEMAHHDLGHIGAGFGRPLFALLRAAVLNGIGRYAKECAADEYAFALCGKAGYDRDRCATLFDVLRHHYLYLGARDAALGSDETIEEEVEGRRDWRTRFRQWNERRKTGYPSMWKRKQRLAGPPAMGG